MDIEAFIDEHLLFGRALIDLEISNKGSNPLWTGFVATNIGEIPAYIKHCRNPDGLCIEIISALLGIWLDIPIPRPIVVLVEPDHPQIAVNKPTYLYGSEMYEMPSFERFLSNSDLKEECLLDCPQLPSVITFDELIANPDRNSSNILFDGESFRFIDHEKAFHPHQNPRSLISEIYKIETIADIVQYYKGDNDVYIHKLMLKIKKIIQNEIETTSCDMLILQAKTCITLTSYNALLDRIRSFLIARIGVLELLIKDAISPPKASNQIDWIGG